MASLLEAISYAIPAYRDAQERRSAMEEKAANRALQQKRFELEERKLRLEELDRLQTLQQRQLQQQTIQQALSLFPEREPSQVVGPAARGTADYGIGEEAGAGLEVEIPGRELPGNRLMRSMLQGGFAEKGLEMAGRQLGLGMDPVTAAYLRNRFGQTPPSAPPAEAPPTGAAFPVRPVPSGTPPAPAGGISTVPKETITFTPQGPRLSVTEEPIRHIVQHETAWDPKTNSSVIYEITTDPYTLRQTRTVVGEGVPPAAIIEARRATEALGIPPTHPAFNQFSNEVIFARTLPAEFQTSYLNDLQQRAQQVLSLPPGSRPPLGVGAPSPVPPAAPGLGAPGQPEGSVGRAIKQTIQREADKTAATTEAAELTKRKTARLEGAEAQKYNFLKSIDDQIPEIIRLYRPEFVGKGFASFNQALRAEFGKQEAAARRGQYVNGAIAGGVRQFFGDIAPEEVAFRKGVRDVANRVLYAFSGAQINEQEFVRLKGALFDLQDEPRVFVPSVQRFQSVLDGMMDSILEVASKPASQLLKERQGRRQEAPPPPSVSEPEPTLNSLQRGAFEHAKEGTPFILQGRRYLKRNGRLVPAGR